MKSATKKRSLNVGQVWSTLGRFGEQAGRKGKFSIAHTRTVCLRRTLCGFWLETTVTVELGERRLVPALFAPSVVVNCKANDMSCVWCPCSTATAWTPVWFWAQSLLQDIARISWKQSSWVTKRTNQEVRCDARKLLQRNDEQTSQGSVRMVWGC